MKQDDAAHTQPPTPKDHSAFFLSRAMIGLGTVVFDILALFGAFYAALFLGDMLSSLLGTTPLTPDYITHTGRGRTYTVIGGVLLFFFFSKGHYTQRIPSWTQIQSIALLCFSAAIFDGFISFSLELYFSRLLIALTWIFAVFFLILGRLTIFHFQKHSSGWKIPTIVIGKASVVCDVLYAFNADPSTGYDPQTIMLLPPSSAAESADDSAGFALDPEEMPRKFRNIAVLEYTRETLQTLLQNNPSAFYVLSLDGFSGNDRDDATRLISGAKVSYATVPPITGLGLYKMEPRYFFGHDVMLMQTKTSGIPLALFAKRGMDIVLSLCSLLALAPVFGGIALFLKLEGQKGSIFYGGRRLGKNGHLFQCWKFRSMEPDSDHLLETYLEANPEERRQWEVYRKLKNDPRITTRTARFIRKSSLDEIPQLWNVFLGDMSLVGPRPILPEEKDLYGNTLSDYLQVNPGITGLWQVSGRNAVNFQRRIYWDSWYVRNWSLWGDIVILLKTIPVVISRADAS